MTEWLKQMSGKVTDFLFPSQCIGCGKTGDFICVHCLNKLPYLLPPLCKKCGRPESSGYYCSNCWGVQTSIETIRSVFVFDGIIREAIHELKYHNLRAIAPCLAKYMTEYYKSNGLPGEALLPVPLHANRLRNRGYNQSALLAEKISELINLPVLHEVLFRIKDSNPQALTPDVHVRRQNVLDAFYCCSGEVVGKEVILIDDVCTSGATLEACAEALKKAGTKKVIGFTLAREI